MTTGSFRHPRESGGLVVFIQSVQVTGATINRPTPKTPLARFFCNWSGWKGIFARPHLPIQFFHTPNLATRFIFLAG